MENRKRHQVIAFRVTEAERRQINAKIRQSGQSQQEYLLHAALGQTIHVVEGLKPILSELRACGRNLNQLTVWPMRGASKPCTCGKRWRHWAGPTTR